MKLPRDVSGPELVKALRKLGYQVDRQRGSHVRVTTRQGGENHEVVPNHHPIKIGTIIDGPFLISEWRELTDPAERVVLP